MSRVFDTTCQSGSESSNFFEWFARLAMKHKFGMFRQGSFCIAFIEIGGLKPAAATVASMSSRVWPEKLSLTSQEFSELELQS